MKVLPILQTAYGGDAIRVGRASKGLDEHCRAAAERRGSRLLVLTLAPPLEVALSDRGDRRLTPGERERIIEMYEEGYQSRPFSEALLDTAGRPPEQSAKLAAEVVLAIR